MPDTMMIKMTEAGQNMYSPTMPALDPDSSTYHLPAQWRSLQSERNGGRVLYNKMKLLGLISQADNRLGHTLLGLDKTFRTGTGKKGLGLGNLAWS